MTEQPDLLSWVQKPKMHVFGGETFDLVRDGKRLNAQLARVHDAFLDGKWHFLADLHEATGDPEASISARYRDLVKLNFPMEKQYVKRGLWKYRMKVEIAA